MNQRPDGRWINILGPLGPANEGQKWRPAEWKQGIGVQFHRQHPDHPPAPPIQWIGRLLGFLGPLENLPAAPPGHANQHQGTYVAAIGHGGYAVPGARMKGPPRQEAAGFDGPAHARVVHRPVLLVTSDVVDNLAVVGKAAWRVEFNLST